MEAEIEKCAELLLQGKVILYPTDTIWGLGCDATNEAAVKRVFQIKHRIEGKSMLVLLPSFSFCDTEDRYKSLPE